MLLLLALELLDPALSRLLLRLERLAQVGDRVGGLLLLRVELPLQALALDVETLDLSLQLQRPPVKILDLAGALPKRVLLGPEQVLEAASLLLLLAELDLVLVADLVGDVQLVDGLLELGRQLVQLRRDLVVVQQESAVLDVEGLVLLLDRGEVLLELLDALLPSPCAAPRGRSCSS